MPYQLLTLFSLAPQPNASTLFDRWREHHLVTPLCVREGVPLQYLSALQTGPAVCADKSSIS